MAEVVSALGGREAGEARAKQRPERVDGPTAGCTEDGFQLGEAELDGVEVGAIGRQEPQGCAGGFDRVAHPVDFVRGKVVRNDDIAGLEGGDEDLLDVGAETDPVHRPVEHAGGREPGDAEAGDERTGLPMPLGGVIGHALAAGAAPIAPKEIGRDAGFIEKDEVGRVKRGRGRRPLRAGGRDVRPVLFGGAHRFF